MRTEIDILDANHVRARVEFEGRDAEWLSLQNPWGALDIALRALDARLCRLGKVALHLEGYSRGHGTIHVECWRFQAKTEPASFLQWRRDSARSRIDVHA